MGRLMWKSAPAFRMLLGGEQDRWRSYSHPRYRRIVSDWTARNISELGTDELLGRARAGGCGRRVLHRGTDHHPDRRHQRNAVTWFYNAAVRSKDAPPALVFVLGFDSEPIRAEKSLYDLATWTRSHQELAESLLGLPRRNSSSGRPPRTIRRGMSGTRVSRLTCAGTVYNLDFMNPVPADDPAPLLETLRFFVSGKRSSGGGRPRGSSGRGNSRCLGTDGYGTRQAFRRLLHWAQSVAPIREDALADVGLAWPQGGACSSRSAGGSSRRA